MCARVCVWPVKFVYLIRKGFFYLLIVYYYYYIRYIIIDHTDYYNIESLTYILKGPYYYKQTVYYIIMYEKRESP